MKYHIATITLFLWMAYEIFFILTLSHKEHKFKEQDGVAHISNQIHNLKNFSRLTSQDMIDMSRRFLKRNRLLNRTCEKFTEELLIQYSSFYKTDRGWSHVIPFMHTNPDILLIRYRHIGWCKVPKSASTSIVHSLLEILGQKSLISHYSRGKLHMKMRGLMPHIKDDEELPRQSFMVVRHPFDRILSAYRDKIANKDEPSQFAKFQRNYSKYIIRKYRRENPVDKKHENIPTFREFVHYLLETPVWEYNEHWMPIYLICTPCFHNFKYILHLETLHTESLYLATMTGIQLHKTRRIHASKAAVDPENKRGTNSANSLERSYYSTINYTELLELYKKFQIEFEMFGYVAYPYTEYTAP